MDAPSDPPQWLPPQAPGARPQPADAPGAPAQPAPSASPAAGQPEPLPAQEPPTQPFATAPPPPAAGAPYGAGQPPVHGWQPQPPAGWPQHYGGGYYQPQDTGPGNESAVAAFVLALSGAGLLLFFAGFSAPVTLVLGILAMVYGRKGKRRVDSGETTKHRSLAQAGLIVGLVTVILSVLAAVGWTLFFIYADNLDFNLDEPGGPGDPDGFDAALRVAGLVVALLARGFA